MNETKLGRQIMVMAIITWIITWVIVSIIAGGLD
jgi:hypothetical protein